MTKQGVELEVAVDLEGVELAVSHLEEAMRALGEAVNEQTSQLREILEKLEGITEDVREFGEHMEETIYQMNRDRYGYESNE